MCSACGSEPQWVSSLYHSFPSDLALDEWHHSACCAGPFLDGGLCFPACSQTLRRPLGNWNEIGLKQVLWKPKRAWTSVKWLKTREMGLRWPWALALFGVHFYLFHFSTNPFTSSTVSLFLLGVILSIVKHLPHIPHPETTPLFWSTALKPQPDSLDIYENSKHSAPRHKYACLRRKALPASLSGGRASWRQANHSQSSWVLQGCV